MFSDVVSDALYDIIASMQPNYCYPNIYPREYVVSMIKSMLLCILISDARLPDGSFVNNKTLADLEADAQIEAELTYDRAMNFDLQATREERNELRSINKTNPML